LKRKWLRRQAKMSSEFEAGEISPAILDKIKRGQRYISTDCDLSERGYIKNRIRSGKQVWENIEERRRADAIGTARRTPESKRESNAKRPLEIKRMDDAKRHYFHGRRYSIDKNPEELMSCLSGTTAESERLATHHIIYDHSNPEFYTIELTVSEHRQLHGGTLTDENIERLQLVFKNREYIVESPEIPEEQNLNLRHPVSINTEFPKGAK